MQKPPADESARPVESTVAAWISSVIATRGTSCENCGSPNARPSFVVPLDRGGRLSTRNAVVLCARCSRVKEIGAPHDLPKETVVSIGLSRRLYDGVQRMLAADGVGTVSSVTRWAISRFLLDPEQFEDLPLYQERAREVQVSVRISHAQYSLFQRLVEATNLSAPEAINALLARFAIGDLKEPA
jgi:hypothetical protein